MKDLLEKFAAKEIAVMDYPGIHAGTNVSEYLRERDARLAQLVASVFTADVVRHKIEIHDPAQPGPVALRNGKKLGFYCSLGTQNVYNLLVDDLLVSLFKLQND